MPYRVYAVRPGFVRALARGRWSRLVSTMGHGPQHPVLGLSFSLSMLCCSRVAGFLGSLLNAASLNMSIPSVDAVIVHVVASPVVPFPPLAGRRPQSVSFWQSKMADVVATRPLVRRADVVPSVQPLMMWILLFGLSAVVPFRSVSACCCGSFRSVPEC